MHRAMASGAFRTSLHVVRVTEEHIIRHSVNTYPLQLAALAMYLSELLDIRFVSSDRFVADHALGRPWDAGSFLCHDIFVAIETCHSCAGVLLVAEKQWLRRRGLRQFFFLTSVDTWGLPVCAAKKKKPGTEGSRQQACAQPHILVLQSVPSIL